MPETGDDPNSPRVVVKILVAESIDQELYRAILQLPVRDRAAFVRLLARNGLHVGMRASESHQVEAATPMRVLPPPAPEAEPQVAAVSRPLEVHDANVAAPRVPVIQF